MVAIKSADGAGKKIQLTTSEIPAYWNSTIANLCGSYARSY
jgi:hypothetical protein